MPIVEYWTDGPLLKAALERAPGMVVYPEEQYTGDETVHYIFWADGGDLDAFEAGLDADPSVTDPRLLTELEARRLYQVTTTDQSYDTATLPEWGDLGVVFLEGEGTHEGWTFRIRVPDRTALAEYRTLHRDSGRPFRLRTIYDESEAETAAEALLTTAQQEALVSAYEAGYFDIPQSASQADVANQLEISPQAVSERLKRGLRTLLEVTVIDT